MSTTTPRIPNTHTCLTKCSPTHLATLLFNGTTCTNIAFISHLWLTQTTARGPPWTHGKYPRTSRKALRFPIERRRPTKPNRAPPGHAAVVDDTLNHRVVAVLVVRKKIEAVHELSPNLHLGLEMDSPRVSKITLPPPPCHERTGTNLLRPNPAPAPQVAAFFLRLNNLHMRRPAPCGSVCASFPYT